MKQTANARFAIKTWDEKPYSEGQDLPKLTRASVTKTKSGTFVLQRLGVFEDGQAKKTYSVVPGSGTGQLRGWRARAVPGHGMEHPFTLDYELV